MTAVVVRAAPPRHRLLLAAAVVAVLLGARAIDLPFSTTGPAAPAAEPEAIAAYASAIRAPIDAGAFTVAEGMRPGVLDIAEGRLTDEVLVQMTASWLASLRQVRTEMAAIAPPTALAEAHGLYLRALDGYVDAARSLAAAAASTGATRGRHVDTAVTAGERADDTYDRAAAELERVRHRQPITPDEEHP